MNSPALEIEDLTVRFGGMVAVNSLTLRSPAGSITALIGPNGAGKTTTFNACAGTVSSTGRVRLGEQDLTGRTPSRRAQYGLGRTFQRIELCDSMTVLENVAMGPECLMAGRSAWRQLASTRRQRAHIANVASEVLERCGLGEVRHQRAGELSTGQRRLTELARALAAGFDFLLLDEPSSGLDVRETERFGEVVDDFVRDQGVGVLLVEHDMALVRLICDYAYVLDFGTLVFDGPVDEVLRSDVVKAAYLGSVVA
jgi:ABC-type branched-subunit amino acid transport system ATPase component